ncbi:MAG: GTPase ObgE [Sedimentisphaeraceae bacterium JB056]
MFIDEAQIYVKAGDGGAGCVSFRREKFMPKGGPDGGNGGDGGNIIFEAAADVDTLLDFSGKHHWKAPNGMPGEGSNKTGEDGEDLIIKVPVGTLIYDTDIDLMIKDMNEAGMRVCVCKAGLGGKGNKEFATSTRQTPRFAQPGTLGDERNLKLELKLIADVGMVGLPNAGKSTFVSVCSKARPKIANYPFTTLSPVLGIAELSGFRRFVVADIPGLIEGAHEGAGLGHDFLKHIERTRTIVHILDIDPPDLSDPAENYRKIRNELERYSDILTHKREVIVANKMDLCPDDEILDQLKKDLGRDDIIPISAATGQGIEELKEVLWKMVKEVQQQEEEEQNEE